MLSSPLGMHMDMHKQECVCGEVVWTAISMFPRLLSTEIHGNEEQRRYTAMRTRSQHIHVHQNLKIVSQNFTLAVRHKELYVLCN